MSLTENLVWDMFTQNDSVQRICFSVTDIFSINPFGVLNDTESLPESSSVVFVEQASNAHLHYVAKNMTY